MKVVRAKLKSISPYSQSHVIGEPKLESETHDDYEKRCWRFRIHADSDGIVFIPPMAFKKALDAAAKYASLKVTGRGNATYTKHVESGTFLYDPLLLDVKRDDVPGEWLFLDANGKKGKQSSGRVLRCMPKVDHWDGYVTIHVLDETVLNTKPKQEDESSKKPITVLQHFLEVAGAMIGIGRFRPENGGFYGRFVVEEFEIHEASDE